MSQLAPPPSSSVGGEGAQALSFSTLQILTVVINIPPLDGSNMRFELKKRELLRSELGKNTFAHLNWWHRKERKKKNGFLHKLLPNW